MNTQDLIRQKRVVIKKAIERSKYTSDSIARLGILQPVKAILARFPAPLSKGNS